ncbi:Conserved_hypothetical protein [Hexamita inflata]|uniref:Uncharacterized protein n=1 Tax=Hexamita inflata TaxID=28002 RepID=A0AA86PCB4_9EUKA|nr:Conserved hypothetical protein [Hexamita inflata]
MCWSTKASFTFAFLFFITCVYLFIRNAPHDRLRVMQFTPILIQEFLQGVLWLVMTPEDTPWTCSEMNKRFSMGFLVVHILPILKLYKDNVIYKAKSYKHFKICSVVSLIQIMLYIGSWILKRLPLCTTIGPHGHQIWNRFEFIDKIPKFYQFLYPIICFTNGFFLKVDLSFYIELILLSGAYIFQLIFHFQERQSRWCWSSSVMLIGYILDPMIVARKFKQQKE